MTRTHVRIRHVTPQPRAAAGFERARWRVSWFSCSHSLCRSRFGGGAPASGQTPAAKPNLLVLMTDDLEVDDLKALPSVRRLAEQGTTFSNSFVGYSLCCPSRATYLTGQYNHNNGVLSNAPPDGGFARLDHTNTLPVWLQAAGYHTTHIGKYLNGYENASSHSTVPPGYSDWQGLAIGTYRMYDYSINDNGTLVPYGTAPADYQTDVLADRAVAAIRERARSPQPFYLKFSPLAPHGSGAVAGHDGRGPDPAPRHRGAFAGEPLDVGPAYDEADVSDKPASIRAAAADQRAGPGGHRRPQPAAAGVAARRRRGDHAHDRRAPRRRRARRDDHRLHVRQRLAGGRASSRPGQGPRVRAVDPGAADHARSRLRRRRRRAGHGDQRRPAAHARGGRGRRPGPRPGRPGPARGGRRIGACARPSAAQRDRRAGALQPQLPPGDPDRDAQVRRARQRRARALRPAQRPGRARQRRGRPGPGRDAGAARRAGSRCSRPAPARRASTRSRLRRRRRRLRRLPSRTR